MEILSSFFIIMLSLINIKSLEVLPFSSIKVSGDSILVTTNNQGNNWMNLISINNITSKQILDYSKQHFTTKVCGVNCYKSRIINEFPTIYKKLTNKDLSDKELVELKDFKNSQKLYILSSNAEKFHLNKKFYELSKKNTHNNVKIFPEYHNIIFKSLNKNNERYLPIFKNQINNGQENFQEELSELEKKIKFKNLSSNLDNLKKDIIKERSIINGLYKAEIIAGIIGGILIVSLIVFYYVFNGLVKETSIASYK